MNKYIINSVKVVQKYVKVVLVLGLHSKVLVCIASILMGSALGSGGSVLKLAGAVSVQHGTAHAIFSQKRLCSPHPATKTLPCKPGTMR